MWYNKANEEAPTSVVALSEHGLFNLTVKEKLNRRWKLYHRGHVSGADVLGTLPLNISTQHRGARLVMLADFAQSHLLPKLKTDTKPKVYAFVVKHLRWARLCALLAWQMDWLHLRDTRQKLLPMVDVSDVVGHATKIVHNVISVWRNARLHVLQNILSGTLTDFALTVEGHGLMMDVFHALSAVSEGKSSGTKLRRLCSRLMETSALVVVKTTPCFLQSIMSTTMEQKNGNSIRTKVTSRFTCVSRTKGFLNAINCFAIIVTVGDI